MRRTTVDLKWVFTYFKYDLMENTNAQKMLKELEVNFKKVDVGFNNKQIHHLQPEENLKAMETLGIIFKEKGKQATQKTYRSFGEGCLIFPLKDDKGNIVNLCALNPKTKQETFLKSSEEGLFPMHIKPHHKEVILCKSCLDAAVLKSKLDNDEEVIIALPKGKLNESIRDYIVKRQKPMLLISMHKVIK